MTKQRRRAVASKNQTAVVSLKLVCLKNFSIFKHGLSE